MPDSREAKGEVRVTQQKETGRKVKQAQREYNHMVQKHIAIKSFPNGPD